MVPVDFLFFYHNRKNKGFIECVQRNSTNTDTKACTSVNPAFGEFCFQNEIRSLLLKATRRKSGKFQMFLQEECSANANVFYSKYTSKLQTYSMLLPQTTISKLQTGSVINY